MSSIKAKVSVPNSDELGKNIGDLKCGTCKHFHSDAQNLGKTGTCRWGPPAMVAIGPGRLYAQYTPINVNLSACSQHLPKIVNQ